MTWSATLLFLHLTASKCVSPEEFRLFFSVRAESMLQLLASKTCQNTSWQDSFYHHHYSWVIKVPHRVLCNTSGHMDLNKKCSQCSLCKCEPDKVRQMITVTQNMAHWSAHPSVTRIPLKHPTHTHALKYTCLYMHKDNCAHTLYAHTFAKIHCQGRKRLSLCLWSLQGWKRAFDPRSQRRCRLASSLVSIP